MPRTHKKLYKTKKPSVAPRPPTPHLSLCPAHQIYHLWHPAWRQLWHMV